jgi:hypothetical protein
MSYPTDLIDTVRLVFRGRRPLGAFRPPDPPGQTSFGGFDSQALSEISCGFHQRPLRVWGECEMPFVAPSRMNTDPGNANDFIYNNVYFRYASLRLFFD